MPVKRRAGKRRIDPEVLYAIWQSVLTSGYDFCGELAEIGVATDEYGRPDREAAREAWARFGERCIAERDPQVGPAWAADEFGLPA